MKIFLFLTFAFFTLPSFAQRNHYALTTSVVCDKTTESGEDEVYAIIAWRTSDGRTSSSRLPAGADHVSINDNIKNDQRTFDGIGLNANLGVIEFDLAPGETIDIFCAIMEQDDGTRGQYDAVGRKILQLVKAPSRFSSVQSATFKNILAETAKRYNLSNSDDWIGTFVYFFGIKTDGGLGSSSSSKMNNDNSGETPNKGEIQNRKTIYEFRGDGSHYYVSFGVK